jgi:hypothetical protein
MLEISPGEHVVERGGQFLRQRAVDTQAQISPAARDAVAFPLRRNVKPADKTRVFIANEQFAVVANVEAPEGEGVEPPHLAARHSQGLPKPVEERDRTERINEHLHADAALAGADQRAPEPLADRSGAKNVALQFDGSFRGVDARQHLGKSFVTGAQPAKPNGVGQRHCGQRIRGQDKLQSSGCVPKA